MEHSRLILLCLLLTSPGVTAQFEDLAACLSGDFLAEFVGCIFAGFGSLDVSSLPPVNEVLGTRDPVDYQTVDNGAVRKLQGASSFDAAPRKYLLGMKMREMNLDDNTIFKDVTSFAQMFSPGKKDQSLLERARNINLKKMIADEYISNFGDHFSEILQKTMQFRQYAHSIESVLYEDRLRQQKDLRNDLLDLLRCLNRYTPADFEDSLDWMQCLIFCDHLGPIAQCSAELFRTTSNEACQRIPWFSDVLSGIIFATLNKTSCIFEVTEPTDLTTPIELIEGGDEKYVDFQMFVPPGVLCLGADPLNDPVSLGLTIAGYVFGFDVTCDVEMQITSANWLNDLLPSADRSSCRIPNRASKQLAIGFHSATVNNSGIFKITDNNWNESISIPLLPVVDHRVDGNATVSFTMKLFVQGQMRGDTVKIPVNIADTDIQAGSGPVECYSVNDPHIMSFDGHYYNNFYHGAFYLYKHDTLPYEVQVIYQPCQSGVNNGTCNCAVAVRSGDDVFVMDRCRRKGLESQPTQTNVLYTNGLLTPGTNVYKMSGGLRHDVVLPHGTIVRIVAINDLLNVWVVPGSYDRGNTKGLCGTFNTNPADDLTLPDGILYTGSGQEIAGQPQGFSQAWRVPEEELIFYGAPSMNDSFSPLETCHCTHILMQGASCECGRGSLTELCDLFIDGAYGSNITSISLPSQYGQHTESFLDDIDLDQSYNPPILSGWAGNWDQLDAEEFCEDLIENSTIPILRYCLDTLSQEYQDAVTFCVQDIQLLDNTNWQYAALDNAKFRCFNHLVRDMSINAQVLSLFPNSSCVNECSGNGQCNNGVCHCVDGFWGPDCRHPTSAEPSFTPKQTQICDNRKQMCHFATINGQNFADTVQMKCKVKNVDISSDGVVYLPRRKTNTWVYDMTVISTSQAVCPLPGNGSYEVTAAWKPAETTVQQASGNNQALLYSRRHKRDLEIDLMDTTSSMTFIYITHDSMCFECDLTGQYCRRKTSTDHCWIDGACWAPGATKPGDACRQCIPETANGQWTFKSGEECEDQQVEEERAAESNRKDRILRGALGGCISALVVIIVIIIFCVSHNKEKKTQMQNSEGMHTSNIMPKSGSVYYEDGEKTHTSSYENAAMSADDDDAEYATIQQGSHGNGSQEQQQLTQTIVDVIKPSGNKSLDDDTLKTVL